MATVGSYRIWTADRDGGVVDVPDPSDSEKNPYPIPGNPAAVDIYFGLDSTAPQPPSKEQGELQGEIEKVLSAVRRLYLPSNGGADGKFRRYYVRLFRLAQLGLEGADASPEVAKSALATVTRDLIDDEASRVKNGHLMELGRVALKFSVPFAAAYIVLTLVDLAWLQPYLAKLGIARTTAANFMLLWVGCFLGVWLSYGIRTATVTLADLTNTDSDRLLPHMRLAFAGALTMVLGMLFVLGIVEVKLGTFVVTRIAEDAMLAFIVGVFCGISEVSLPAVASKRATAFVGDLK